MTKNVGQIERYIRIAVGALLVSMIFWGPQSYWFALGLVPLTTGLLGWCPPYQLLGISTCKTK